MLETQCGAGHCPAALGGRAGKATANLGRRITVRQDGKGDFTTIQAAIDAAELWDL